MPRVNCEEGYFQDLSMCRNMDHHMNMRWFGFWDHAGSGSGGLVTKLYPAICRPMDSSQTGSSAHRISQARTVEWVTISFIFFKQRMRLRVEREILLMYFLYLVNFVLLLMYIYCMFLSKKKKNMFSKVNRPKSS